MRDAGIAAEVDLTGGKIGRQFKAADERGCRFTLVMGPDEQESNTVMIKDLTTGSQEAVPVAQAAEHILKLLAI